MNAGPIRMPVRSKVTCPREARVPDLDADVTASVPEAAVVASTAAPAFGV
jgi:hypothetical protein